MPNPSDADAGRSKPPRATVRELSVIFLRLGFTAFGGPAAHVAIMEDEFVRRRAWLTPERFLDLLGAANLIPGPSSTELAIYIGYEQAGWRGLVLAGACFILPAALMVGAIAAAYVRFAALPGFAGALYGIRPVVIGVVLQALWGLAPKAIKRSYRLAGVAFVSLVAFALGVEALAVLIGAGTINMTLHQVATMTKRDRELRGIAPAFALAAGMTAAAPTASLLGILLVFAKIGSLVFGSGYVLLAFLRSELVLRLHWLTESQLLDAIAVGQLTPGPVFTAATFIGYLLHGVPGAAVATVGIFLPGFVLVSATRPLIARVRQSPTAGAFLDGVNVASLGLMSVVAFQLARDALVDLPTLLIAVTGAVLLLVYKVNATWLVAGAALVGMLHPPP